MNTAGEGWEMKSGMHESWWKKWFTYSASMSVESIGLIDETLL